MTGVTDGWSLQKRANKSDYKVQEEKTVIQMCNEVVLEKELKSQSSMMMAQIWLCEEKAISAVETITELKGVLIEFADVFEPPTGFPRERDIDHKISLIPEAKPVNLRPYRY